MLLDEIGQFLIDQNLVGGATGWTLAKGWMPPEPNKVVGVFEYPGEPPFAGRIEIDIPAFQIRVRAEKEDYVAARTEIEAIYLALHGYSGTLSGVYYVMITALASPLPLGRDENERPEIVQNFSAKRSR